MSFLEGIVEIIGNNGAASAALESTINGLGEAVEGGGTIDEETQEGIKDSQEAIKDVVSSLEKGEPGAAEEAEALENKMAKMDAWEDPKAFGKFAGNELAKGALFTLGLQVVQTAFQTYFSASGAADAGQLKIIQAINQAGTPLQDALDTWCKWQAAHYDERGEYGAISAMGMDIQLFQIFQNQVVNLCDQRDKLAPLLKNAQQTKALDDVKALLTADIAYAQAVLDASNTITNQMSAMTAAGLPTNITDVQAACTTLVSAST